MRNFFVFIFLIFMLLTCNVFAKASAPTGYTGNRVIESRIGNGIFVTVENGKKGIVDNNDNLILPCEYDDIIAYVWRDIIVRKGDKYGVVSRSGEEIYPVKYKSIEKKYEMFIIEDFEGKKGIYRSINLKTGIIYDEVNIFENMFGKYAKVKLDGKYGVLDTQTMSPVIPVEYDMMSKITGTPDTDTTHTIVHKDGKFGLWHIAPDKYSAAGKDTVERILPDEYDFIYYKLFHWYIFLKDGKYGFYDAKKHKLSKAKYDKITSAKTFINDGSALKLQKGRLKYTHHRDNIAKRTWDTTVVLVELPLFWLAWR